MILIVEDDIDLADTCAMLLEFHGFRVTIVDNGLAALKSMAMRVPALILTDCQMPFMGGLELCARIRATPALQTLPVILMSGTDRHPFMDTVHYNLFLRKPFLAARLLDAVHALINASSTPAERPTVH